MGTQTRTVLPKKLIAEWHRIGRSNPPDFSLALPSIRDMRNAPATFGSMFSRARELVACTAPNAALVRRIGHTCAKMLDADRWEMLLRDPSHCPASEQYLLGNRAADERRRDLGDSCGRWVRARL